MRTQAADGASILHFRHNYAGKENSATIEIKKGRNKNINISLTGSVLCTKMADIDNCYSMYVPGLAGIPFTEEYRSLGAIRRAVAKGDSNTILRNVLYHLSQDTIKWDNFESDLNAIFPNIHINIDARLDNDGIIDVFVKDKTYEKPLDAMGTGVLQAIQISAYMNYFEPQLLLLDEPDSHLHPNNQKTLAQMIMQISQKNTNILLATHSRHLVSALRKDAQVIFMKNGEIVSTNFDEYDLLMELGALDEYDVFRDPKIKYIVATEDIKPDSNDMLKKILNASGFDESSYFILPYESASKIDSVIYLAKCLSKFRSDLSIIVHRDADGMYPDEIDEFKSNIETEKNTFCFITQYNDLEMYFCSTDHIYTVLIDNNYSVDRNDIDTMVRKCIQAVDSKSKVKFLNRKLDQIRNGKGDESIKAHNYYDNNTIKCINGHFLFSALVSVIHQKYHADKDVLMQSSEYLCDSNLKDIAEQPIQTTL